MAKTALSENIQPYLLLKNLVRNLNFLNCKRMCLFLFYTILNAGRHWVYEKKTLINCIATSHASELI